MPVGVVPPRPVDPFEHRHGRGPGPPRQALHLPDGFHRITGIARVQPGSELLSSAPLAASMASATSRLITCDPMA